MSTSGLQGQWLQDSSKNHRSSQYHEAHARNPAPRRLGLVHNMPHFVDFQLLSLTNWLPRPTRLAQQCNLVKICHCQWTCLQCSIIFNSLMWDPHQILNLREFSVHTLAVDCTENVGQFYAHRPAGTLRCAPNACKTGPHPITTEND